jgi:hypothetical protein
MDHRRHFVESVAAIGKPEILLEGGFQKRFSEWFMEARRSFLVLKIRQSKMVRSSVLIHI